MASSRLGTSISIFPVPSSTSPNDIGIPTMFEISTYVDVGGLASYGADSDAIGRQAARMIDKIIRGEDPGTIPVETPERLILVVNLRTANYLGLSIPQVILFQADRIIR